MDKFSIKNTTREQREQIVRESLGYSDISCEDVDGYDMYIPYIEGEKELRDINMEYQARYVKDMEREERRSCWM
ncbi:MAG: purine biosynthesis protein PurH [Lachnospiraceae bacterium]|nr:purine biosynthesis protein PurH [Lachnospiraceae bacterium]